MYGFDGCFSDGVLFVRKVIKLKILVQSFETVCQLFHNLKKELSHKCNVKQILRCTLDYPILYSVKLQE